MEIVSFVILILLFGFALLALLHPFWGIVECAVTTDRGGVSKGFWVIVMLLTWTVGSLAYGLFVTTSKTLRRATLILVLPMLLLTIFSGIVLLRDLGAREQFMRQMMGQESGSTSDQQILDAHNETTHS